MKVAQALDRIGAKLREKQRQLDEARVRLARVTARAAEVLGDSRRGEEWLNRYNVALGCVPASLVETDTGVETVLVTLGRLEHGVVG